MILVFSMAAAIWGIGIAMKAPHSARWTMIGILLVGVIAGHVALPKGHPIRANTGGSAALWLLILAGAGLVWAYSKVLGRVRERAQAQEAARAPASGKTGFSDTELARYARHIVLREIGGPGQSALRDARVLVIGAGGLGAAALQYLAAAGVGIIGVIDDDLVENTNLQRQVIHRDATIGMPKVHSAAEAMRAQNPFVTVRPYNRRLTPEIADDLFADYDLILDGSDNFETRYLANRTAVTAGKPLIAAALTQWEGQIALYHPAAGGPCYACLFPDPPDPALVPSCAEAGVLGPLPGVIGSMMAVEAVKVIAGAGTPLLGRLLIYDALDAETRVLKALRRPDCPVCGMAGASARG